MMTAIDEARLKQLLKETIIEILEERKDILSEALIEAVEDVALAKAIKEAENTPLVSRADVFRLLEDTP